MTFDEWADHIALRVSAAVPGVDIKRKVEDLCRLIYRGKECQVHAVSDSSAAFVALRVESGTVTCPLSTHVRIGSDSEEEVARRIIGWLVPNNISSRADISV